MNVSELSSLKKRKSTYLLNFNTNTGMPTQFQTLDDQPQKKLSLTRAKNSASVERMLKANQELKSGLLKSMDEMQRKLQICMDKRKNDLKEIVSE